MAKLRVRIPLTLAWPLKNLFTRFTLAQPALAGTDFSFQVTLYSAPIKKPQTRLRSYEVYLLVEEGRHFANTSYAHDFISFPLKTRERIYEKCAQLYDQGLSLRDISERTGIAKSTIQDAFKEHQYPARTHKQTLKGKKSGKKFKCGGIPPYGFAYLDGRLVVDPKETLVVRKILKYSQSGKSIRAITKELNDQKIATRSGKCWYVSMVKRVIDFNKNNNQK